MDLEEFGRRGLAAQKAVDVAVAQSLVGRWVKFAHQPEGPGHKVTRATDEGMVELEDMVGEFASHCFVPA